MWMLEQTKKSMWTNNTMKENIKEWIKILFIAIFYLGGFFIVLYGIKLIMGEI
jgi:hypothetical protein